MTINIMKSKKIYLPSGAVTGTFTGCFWTWITRVFVSFVGIVLPDHALFTGCSTCLFHFLGYLSLCTFLARRFVVFVLPRSIRTNIAAAFVFDYEKSSIAIIFTCWLIWCIVVFPRHAFDTRWDTAKYTARLTYCCTSSRKSCVTGDSNGLACGSSNTFGVFFVGIDDITIRCTGVGITRLC